MEELEVIDPVSDSSLGYMYLFLSDGSPDQSAGSPLLEYFFNLTTTKLKLMMIIITSKSNIT